MLEKIMLTWSRMRAAYDRKRREEQEKAEERRIYRKWLNRVLENQPKIKLS